MRDFLWIWQSLHSFVFSVRFRRRYIYGCTRLNLNVYHQYDRSETQALPHSFCFDLLDSVYAQFLNPDFTVVVQAQERVQGPARLNSASISALAQSLRYSSIPIDRSVNRQVSCDICTYCNPPSSFDSNSPNSRSCHPLLLLLLNGRYILMFLAYRLYDIGQSYTGW